jgi:hypothetical protein
MDGEQIDPGKTVSHAHRAKQVERAGCLQGEGNESFIDPQRAVFKKPLKAQPNHHSHAEKPEKVLALF